MSSQVYDTQFGEFSLHFDAESIEAWIGADVFEADSEQYPTFDLLSVVLSGIDDVGNCVGEMDKQHFEAIERFVFAIQERLMAFKPVDGMHARALNEGCDG